MPSGEVPSGDSSSTPSGEAPDGAPGNGGGQSQAPTSYTAATEFSSDTTTTDETYDSTGTGENAVLISGGKVVLNNPTVTRTSSDSTGGDNASFYGVGASILNDGGEAYVNGGIFYTTNTASNFYVENVDITSTQDGGADYFLRVSGNTNARGWGSTGSNGADCTFTASDQEMDGDIIYDSISNLDLYMENGSVLTGGIIDDESATGGTTGDGQANVYISDDSKWVVTKDSTLTNLYNEGTIVDSDGNTVSIVGTDGTTYVEGTSSYTITVSGTYSTTADFSGATSAPSWSDYEVECPSELTADALGTKTATATSAESD